MHKQTKPVEFLGSALNDLRDFPVSARREAGYQIDNVQHGDEPDDWKPMKTIGAGVQEIRIQDEAGASPSSKTLSMCCTVSIRKRKEPPRKILRWQANGITNSCEV